MPEPKHRPGSAAAIAEGCSCDPKANAHGSGRPSATGPVYFPDNHCPLHGLTLAIAGVLSEEAVILDDGGEDEEATAPSSSMRQHHLE